MSVEMCFLKLYILHNFELPDFANRDVQILTKYIFKMLRC